LRRIRRLRWAQKWLRALTRRRTWTSRGIRTSRRALSTTPAVIAVPPEIRVRRFGGFRLRLFDQGKAHLG
jgi:hypothetical protein